MRICAAILAVLLCSACGGELFRQYEYEEEMYLALDGSAVVYVNSSVAALNALRGTTFDVKPNARVDRAAVTAFFSSPVTEVRSVKESRRGWQKTASTRMGIVALGTKRGFFSSRLAADSPDERRRTMRPARHRCKESG